jgi:hypothetical protein
VLATRAADRESGPSRPRRRCIDRIYGRRPGPVRGGPEC